MHGINIVFILQELRMQTLKIFTRAKLKGLQYAWCDVPSIKTIARQMVIKYGWACLAVVVHETRRCKQGEVWSGL